MSSEVLLKQQYLHQLNLVQRFCSKMFLYPFQGIKKKTLFGYYLVSCLILVTSIQLLITLCLTGFRDPLEIIYITPNIGVCFMSTVKYFKTHSNRAMYERIFEHFRNNLWEIVTICPEKNYKTVTKYKSVASHINKFVLFLASVLIIIFASFPITVMFYESKILNRELRYLFPFDEWYPFDKLQWYLLVYVWEIIMTAFVVMIFGCCDLLNLIVITFVCMELKLLGNCLEELVTFENVENLMTRTFIVETNDDINQRLKSIIKRHATLTKIALDLDGVLGVVMLLNFTIGSIFICVTAFTYWVVNDTYQSFRYLLFCVGVVIAIFDQCVMGQALSSHSENLSNSVYFSNWMCVDNKIKKTYLMLMIKTQKPLNLTANGLVVMNLLAFSRICSTSYQFFNLLLTTIK